MDGFNSNMEKDKISPESLHDSEPATLTIKVAYGVNKHKVAVPSRYTFGDLKSAIVKKFGLNPETHKLFFRGKEKDPDDLLRTAGMKDNSKVLLMEDTACRQKSPEPEEAIEPIVVSRGEEAVAKVREEVDKLADQVAALKAVVDSGTQVDNKDFLYLTEMLMRQLLILDGIDAEGEGRVQRKMEVRRVQSFVDTVDILKSKNSNPIIHGDNNSSVTTQQVESENGSGSLNTASPPPSPSAAPSPTHEPAHTTTPIPLPSSPSPSPMSSYIHIPIQSSTPGTFSVPITTRSPPSASSATKAGTFSVPITTGSPPSASSPMPSTKAGTFSVPITTGSPPSASSTKAGTFCVPITTRSPPSASSPTKPGTFRVPITTRSSPSASSPTNVSQD